MATIAALGRIYRGGMFTALCTLMATLFAIMCLQVFFRYVLNASLIWAEEVCRYLLIWATFLGLGVAYQRGEIAALHMLVDKLSRRAALAVATGARVLMLVLLGYIVVYGWLYAAAMQRQTIPAADFIWTGVLGGTGAAGVSIFWIYLAVPVGSAILAVHIIIELLQSLIAGKARQEPS